MYVGLVLAHRYELLERLGAGGMGSVWRAHDKTLNATVAIKLIDPQLVESPTALARFRQEAQAAAAIRSTYVVQMLDCGVDDGVPFIAMELLKGMSLAERLKARGRLTPEATGHVMGHVARAIAQAHAHGIVHRDLKPENIFLVSEDDEEIAKVLDFGVARRTSGLEDDGGPKTRTGAVLGTPFYMSPEQATGQPVDHLTDIWSFGVIVCECLAGKRLFTGGSLGSLFHSICMAPMPVPAQIGIELAGFDHWFKRAVCRDRSLRFQSIKETAEELRALCRQSTLRSSTPDFVEDVAGTIESAQLFDDSAASGPESGTKDELSIPVSLGDAPIVVTVGQTGDPSSRSIAPLPRPTAISIRGLTWLALAVVVGVVLATIRWQTRGEANTSAAATAEPSTPSATPVAAQQGAPVPLPRPSPLPSLGTSAMPAAAAVAKPSRVPPATGAHSPKTVPATKPVSSASPASDASKLPAKIPVTDDNAAEI